MKRATLEALNQARAEKRPVVLVTALGDGSQQVLDPTAESSGHAELVAAAAQALRTDRSRTVTLISSDAAVCMHQHPIAAQTNEVGSMPALVEQLHRIYGRSALFRMVTTDAGNTSCEAAGCIIDAS